MRDKLIELMNNGFYVSPKDELNGVVQKAADYLIAHGVTVQADVPDNNVGNKTTLTNGDRIRAMTDEELAVWLENLSANCFGCITDYPGEHTNCPIRPEGACVCGEKDFINWLKQPAKEETCIQSDM